MTHSHSLFTFISGRHARPTEHLHARVLQKLDFLNHTQAGPALSMQVFIKVQCITWRSVLEGKSFFFSVLTDAYIRSDDKLFIPPWQHPMQKKRKKERNGNCILFLLHVCALGTAWFKPDKISKKDVSGWRPKITFLYLFLFHSLLHLTSFISQTKNYNACEPQVMASTISVGAVSEWTSLYELSTLDYCWTPLSISDRKLEPSGRSRQHGLRCIIGHTLWRMVQWCIWLTHLTLVFEVIWYRLVQGDRRKVALFHAIESAILGDLLTYIIVRLKHLAMQTCFYHLPPYIFSIADAI